MKLGARYVIGLVAVAAVSIVGRLTLSGEPGPDDTGGIPLRGPDDVVVVVPLVPPPLPVAKPEIVTPRPVGSFEFVRNCSDERLPGYDPYGPGCNDRDLPTETEITFEPPPPPAVAPPMPMMQCNRAHCDD